DVRLAFPPGARADAERALRGDLSALPARRINERGIPDGMLTIRARMCPTCHASARGRLYEWTGSKDRGLTPWLDLPESTARGIAEAARKRCPPRQALPPTTTGS